MKEMFESNLVPYFPVVFVSILYGEACNVTMVLKDAPASKSLLIIMLCIALVMAIALIQFRINRLIWARLFERKSSKHCKYWTIELCVCVIVCL